MVSVEKIIEKMLNQPHGIKLAEAEKCWPHMAILSRGRKAHTGIILTKKAI